MKILHIISQKPGDTGSGIYAVNIIEQLQRRGHKQAFICATDGEEKIEMNDVDIYPIKFSSNKLPFNVVGMSDSMPYNSTKYKELSLQQLQSFKEEFSNIINMANKEFDPDIIVCHHLYLVTALVVSIIKNKKVFGICHSTDLRQLMSHHMENDFIIDNIKKLDGIFALHNSCKEQIKEIFHMNDDKIYVTGIGFDNNMFFNRNVRKNENIQIVFTGKVCYAKGLKSMYNAFSYFIESYPSATLNIVGMGTGKEWMEIRELYSKSKGKVKFWGKLSHEELSRLYSRSHIFMLPSFYEGLPLVIVEALASGLYVVSSDISGVKSWLGKDIISSGRIEFVDLPSMKSVDEPIEEELPMYEKNLCEALKHMIFKIENNNMVDVDISALSWSGLSDKILEIIKGI